MGDKQMRDTTWDNRHVCYFCRPDQYPEMPEKHTLCSRCGVLIEIPIEDPMNDSMFVCDQCEIEILEEEEKWV